MNKRIFFVCSFALTLTCSNARAQYFAIGSLTIPKSVSANGMGGISGSVLSDDPVAVMDNPGQLGAFSLNNFFSASTYTPRTHWLPSGSLVPPITLNSSAFSAGMEFGHYLDLPFKAGIGIGYSDYRFSGWTIDEGSKDFTIGLGIDYLVRFGFGYTFGSTATTFTVDTSRNASSPPVTYNAKLPAHDIGAIMEIPVVGIISKLSNRSVQIGDGISPVFDITIGTSGRNIGSEVDYSNADLALPLPRQSMLGWSLRGGLQTRQDGRVWHLLTLTWAREASDVLATQTVSTAGTTAVYSFGYEKGFGTIQPFENLVLGKTNGRITLGKGWEIDAADCLYLRWGSDTGPGELIYSTSGWSVKLDGLLRLLTAGSIIPPGTPVVGFLMNHMDLEYSFAKYYSGVNDGIDGTKFSALTLVVR